MTSGGAGPAAEPRGAGYGIGLAAFASVLFAALVIAAFGVTSLLTDAEVIPERDAGPLVGPAMVGAAVVVFFLRLVRRLLLLAADPDSAHRMLAPALVTGLLVTVAYLAAGAAVYALAAGEPVALLLFAGAHAPTAFTASVLVAGFAVHLAAVAVFGRREAGGETPRWGWERDEDVE